MLIWRRWWIDFRAALIRDPVARLRYLRQAQAAPPWRPSARAAAIAAATVLAAIAALPQREPSQAETAVRRQMAWPSGPGETNSKDSVWLVERKGDVEVFSNGLQIQCDATVANRPRQVIRVTTDGLTVSGGEPSPVGIVYHTTESHIAPFAEEANRTLRKATLGVREYVAKNRSYHYLIDRFGRVHRIVPESDAANHAGESIWGDPPRVWMNLNDSFLGVAFEAASAGAAPPVTPAQVHAGAILTAMLRARYPIAEANCVTHAQVSVNPGNMRIGHHVDWGAGFPFDAMGLPDNYQRPPVSIYRFGFGYDEAFLAVTGRGWKGLREADSRLKQEATANGVSPGRYRAVLAARYRGFAIKLDEAARQISQARRVTQ